SLTINSKDLKTARLYGVPLWSTAKPWTKDGRQTLLLLLEHGAGVTRNSRHASKEQTHEAENSEKPPVVLSSSLEGAWDMLWAGRGSRAVRAARATRQRSLDELATPAPERRLEAGPRHGLPQGLAAAVGVVRHRQRNNDGEEGEGEEEEEEEEGTPPALVPPTSGGGTRSPLLRGRTSARQFRRRRFQKGRGRR
ncbi:unnamed protein product, partial [Prorocentrum cordatum]